MTAPLPAIAAEDGAGRWSWPISPPRDNAAVVVRPAEARAVADLGVRNPPHWTPRPPRTADGPCSTWSRFC
ncbi:hypothetical protein [Streptomyces sp. NPDC047718]|uniref:hypothetical protein n=1 Tax=Streptomyces sp. NPDC047718 TaxID=3155479 RepID=UPI0033E34663